MNVVHHDTAEHKDAKVLGSTRYCFEWIMRLGILAAVLLGFLYVMLLNSLATQGFALEEIKAERIAIQQEIEKWDISLAIPTSLYALHSSEQVQRMEEVTDKKYVQVEAGRVAFSQ